LKLNNFSYLKDYRNLKVLVTGSTGFKGTWLIFWLNKLGAKVVGIGLKPESDSVLFKELKIQNKSKQYINNIENFDKTNQIIKKEKPDIIFHLAAQSIVSESYKDPLGTIRTNTLGSANILESVRLNKIKNLVFITSDKCYLNRELKRSYNELDVLGGYDNYSSSKAAAEVIFHSYYNCYFKNKNLFTATARAGNVIGGGDFKKNRIISDLFKSIQLNKKLTLRNPKST
jgi:CDP-glucose 4,6-dehydratase